MTGRVEKIGNLGAATPRCMAKVRLSATMTLTRVQRERRAKDWGLPADVCGWYAVRRIDGDPLCLSHAGQRALAILSGEA